jgi:hypothetical protein
MERYGLQHTILCDYQVVFYDVTNEIEFKYDSGCAAYYDYATVGYMDHTRTKGDTMRNPGAGYMAGNNPHSSNFRISTDGNDHGYEAFSTGIKPVTNAAQVISGSSGGTPTGYYCSYSYYWNQYKTGCNANIDLPSGFQFDYFQKSFDGDDSNDRLRIGRNGYLYMIDNGSTSLERGITTWGTTCLRYHTRATLLLDQVQLHHGGAITAVTTAMITQHTIVVSMSVQCHSKARVLMSTTTLIVLETT